MLFRKIHRGDSNEDGDEVFSKELSSTSDKFEMMSNRSFVEKRIVELEDNIVDESALKQVEDARYTREN